jgi:uncharacterized damage-inducible protein DinB
MSITKIIQNYSAYNEWANHKTINWLQDQNEGILYTETPSSYKSLDQTLQHILKAQQFWLAFITETELKDFSWRMVEGKVQENLTDLKNNSSAMKLIFCQFSEDDLNKTLSLNTRWAKNELSRYEYILHVINHSTYHRGQLVTMSRCLGLIEGVPNTDYNMFRADH